MAESATDEPHRPNLIGNMVGRMAPVVMRQIDTNDLVDALDVDVIAADLDLDALIGRLDINALAAQLDLDELVGRLDIDALAQRLDLDALLQRLDLDALIDRLDIDDIAARLDIEALIGRIDMARLTAGAGQDVAVSGLDLVRRQFVRADASVDGVVDRVLRRRPGKRPDAPGGLVDVAELPTADEPADPHELQRRDVSGHYAGPVSRGLTVVADVAAVLGLNAAVVSMILFLLGALGDSDPSQETSGLIALGCLAMVFVSWFWIPVALFGRTPAMALLGLAVVRRDGGVARGTRALLRAVVLPISVFIPILFLGLILGKERRTLHDMAAGTTVVYDWGSREAEQPVTIREQLSARVRRSQLERPDPG